MNKLRFDGKTALITGSGGGLGKSHALFLAERGANIVVNDPGSGLSGDSNDPGPAFNTVEEIKMAGANAVANTDSVASREGAEAMIRKAIEQFGSLDIIINNAGILRDKSFGKLPEEDWDSVIAVHLKGSFNVTRAAWNMMKEKGYGRILMTSSAAGLYGNFGQAAYSAAKMALVGLGRTLAQEGAKYNIHTNIIAPIARSRMTETILPAKLLEKLGPELISPFAAWLCHEDCDSNGGIYEVGGGMITRLEWTRSAPYIMDSDINSAIEALKENQDRIKSMSDNEICTSFKSSLEQLIAIANKGSRQ